MVCTKCGQALMEGAAFCPYCGEKVSLEMAENETPIYQAVIKTLLKSGTLSVYCDRTEFVTSSVQKIIFRYSSLIAVKKSWSMDHIDFVTEDGQTVSCPVGRKNIHEAFLYIDQASKPYIEERKRELSSQGIQYSLVSSQGLTGGVLNLSDSQAEFRAKSGQSEILSFQDVKSVGLSPIGALEFSLFDGRTKAFGIDKEKRDDVLFFLNQAIEPYLAKRKEDLLSRGIYYSSLSSYGSEGGTLEVLEDRVVFKGKSGRTESVSFSDVREVNLFTEMMEFSLTDGTSRSFAVERELRDEVLSFVQNAISPYVQKRTVGFDLSFGIDERIEVNEQRSVFHILRQGGKEITEEIPMAALEKCERVEGCDSEGVLDSVVSGGLGIINRAAKAVGTQGVSGTEERIRYVGFVLTFRTDQGVQTECVRFGDFLMGMNRTNKKYEEYVAEMSNFLDYLDGNCPGCEVIVPVLPEPESGLVEMVPDDSCTEELPAESGKVVENTLSVKKDPFGITKYIEGVCRFVGNCGTPMSIAIQGNGSSGQNSIMNLLFEHLKEHGYENLFWFHAWQFFQSKSDKPLPVRVGNKLIAQLGDTGSEDLKERAGQMISGLFKVATGMLSQGSTDGQDLIDAISGNGAEDPLGKITKAFSALVKERIGNRTDKVIFFVDEIDKLAPAKGVELMETIKNSFECEGCIFVTAMDYPFLIRGAQELYGQFLDENQEKSFWGKMFQISFRVPASGYQMQEYVKDKLEDIGIDSGDERELGVFVELIRHSVGSEPKNAERLFGSFLLLKNMAEEEMYKDRYKRQVLFALLCMQTRFHDIYHYLVRMRNSVTPDFLSRVYDGQPDVLDGLPLSENEKETFTAFSRTFYEIINTDREKGISAQECEAFREVLEFSSITAQ